jgi:hypothetical protein
MKSFSKIKVAHLIRAVLLENIAVIIFKEFFARENKLVGFGPFCVLTMELTNE